MRFAYYLGLFLLWPMMGLNAAPTLTYKTLAEIADYPVSRVSAQVIPDNESRIAAEITAKVDSILVRTGQQVKRGDVLARLDARQFDIELASAKAQAEILKNRLALAELQLAQNETLRQQQYVSEDVIKQKQTEASVIRAELDVARQHIKQAELMLERTVIKSPFAGTVKARQANVGELAAPGSVLLIVTETGRSEIRAMVPELQLPSLRQSASQVFRVAGRDIPVSVQRISGVVDGRDQTREVVFRTTQTLASGVSGELRWQSSTPYLPSGYVQSRGKDLGVWIIENGQSVFVVLPMAQAGRPVPVNMKRDTKIIDKGRFSLNPQSTPSAVSPVKTSKK